MPRSANFQVKTSENYDFNGIVEVTEFESTAPLLNISWVGCYADDSDRDLDAGPQAYVHNSSNCMELCRGYAYMAIQFESWCSCGNRYATAARYNQLPDNECENPCRGDIGLSSDFHCGGYMKNAIYFLEKGPVLPLIWKGCYVDDVNRDFQELGSVTG